MSYFVNALGIRQWADRVGSRYTLPQVIRRLVSATTKEIITVDFPCKNPRESLDRMYENEDLMSLCEGLGQAAVTTAAKIDQSDFARSRHPSSPRLAPMSRFRRRG